MTTLAGKLKFAGLVLLRCFCGFLTMAASLIPSYITISLEDIGRTDEQMWWWETADLVLLGAAWNSGILFLLVLGLWFAVGFGLCMLVERLVAKLFRFARGSS
jgi:hypothetical protein